LRKYADIDNYLWYHAISSIRSDPDSYTNNFYLYKSFFSDPFNFIPWDFDKTFTGNIGLYGPNEIIESLVRNQEIFSAYKEKVKYIIDNIFTEENLFPIIDRLYNQMEEYYKYDPFLANRNIKQETDNIKSFITQRRIELNGMLNNAEN